MSFDNKESGRIFGYACVSSKEQNLDRQVVALEKYVPKANILTDKASGKNIEREAYQALKSVLGLRSGDTLYICSLDRLSRNKSDIKRELEWFKANGVRLKVLDLPTSLIEVPEGQAWIQDMTTNILVEILSSMAEQERLTIRKRQREGIEAAKAKGKHLGRPQMVIPEEFEEVYREWRAGKITAKCAMNELGMTSSSFYRCIRAYESGKNKPV